MAIAEREISQNPTLPAFVSEQEYLAREEAASEKSEYVQGRITPMSGGTDTHGALAMRMGYCLIAALKGRDCWVMSSDVKIYAAGAMYYPDASVTCGPRVYHHANRTVISNPVALVEILSPSTEVKDRGEKFLHYQKIESLMSYLLVSQDAPLVEQYSRIDNGRWDYVAVRGLEGLVTLPALSVTLALAEIYDQIDFGRSVSHE